MADGTFRYKVEIDQQSMQQQMAQMQQAIAISADLSQSSPTAQLIGNARAMGVGFNTIMQNLTQASAALNPFPQHIDSLTPMTFGGAAMGSLGMYAPNTMRVGQFQRLSRDDIRHRVASAVSEMPLSTMETAMDWIPSIIGGEIGASYMGSGLIPGLAGAIGGGMLASTLALPITAAVGYGASKTRDHLRFQSRSESMLRAASYGKMGMNDRREISTNIRKMLSNDEALNFNEGADIMAYGTESGLLRTNQDVDEYSRNYKNLLDSVKKVMQTLHKSVKDSVELIAEMKRTGVTDLNQIGPEAVMMQSRAAYAGMSPEQMMNIRRTGSSIGVGTPLGGRNAGVSSEISAGFLSKMLSSGRMSENDIYRATGATGVEGIANMSQQITAGIAGFSRSGPGQGLISGLLNEDLQLDQDALKSVLQGKLSPAELVRRSSMNVLKHGEASVRRGSDLAFERMKPQQVMELMISAAVNELEVTPGADLNDANVAAVLQGLGVSKSASEAMASMRNNMGIFQEMQREDAGSLFTQIADERRRSRTLGARFKRGAYGITGRAADEALDIASSISDPISGYLDILGGSAKVNFNGAQVRREDYIDIDTSVNAQTGRRDLGNLAMRTGLNFVAGKLSPIPIDVASKIPGPDVTSGDVFVKNRIADQLRSEGRKTSFLTKMSKLGEVLLGGGIAKIAAGEELNVEKSAKAGFGLPTMADMVEWGGAAPLVTSIFGKSAEEMYYAPEKQEYNDFLLKKSATIQAIIENQDQYDKDPAFRARMQENLEAGDPHGGVFGKSLVNMVSEYSKKGKEGYGQLKEDFRKIGARENLRNIKAAAAATMEKLTESGALKEASPRFKASLEKLAKEGSGESLFKFIDIAKTETTGIMDKTEIQTLVETVQSLQTGGRVKPKEDSDKRTEAQQREEYRLKASEIHTIIKDIHLHGLKVKMWG